jgi:hypothetical protein
MPEYNEVMPEEINPIYTAQGIDLAILKPDIKVNQMYKKVPNFIDEIIYETDEKGNLLPEKDGYGAIQKDSKGNIIYKTKGVQKVQDGYVVVVKPIPAPNFANINRNTSNLTGDDVAFQELLDEQDSRLMLVQELIDEYGRDLSKTLFRHNVVRTSIETLSKGKNQVTVQAIKTFITKSDSKKSVENWDVQAQSGKPITKPGNLLEAVQREQSQR